MNLINFLVIILAMSMLDFVMETESKGHCANVKAPLLGLRKKRHLTFPPGTSVVLTMSLLKALMRHALISAFSNDMVSSGWNVAVEIDVIYPLLSPEMMTALFRKKLHHRQKREFWEMIDNAFASYNMNGRSCVYRSICEAKLHLAPPGRSLVHDILRSIFSAPIHEAEFREEINGTYEDLLQPNFCESIHDCPISLLETILAFNKNR